MGENIGMAARAMMNCGLADLRLVNPRDEWPNRHALAASAGANEIIEEAQVFATTGRAIADLQIIYATTARPRDMTTEVMKFCRGELEMSEQSFLMQNNFKQKMI